MDKFKLTKEQVEVAEKFEAKAKVLIEKGKKHGKESLTLEERKYLGLFVMYTKIRWLRKITPTGRFSVG